MEELRRIQEEIDQRRRAQEEAEARARADAEELARKQEQERLEALEQKRRRNYIEWFDMRIEAMMDLIISSDLDKHMSDLLRSYFKLVKST